jgi:hypothetical protein
LSTIPSLSSSPFSHRTFVSDPVQREETQHQQIDATITEGKPVLYRYRLAEIKEARAIILRRHSSLLLKTGSFGESLIILSLSLPRIYKSCDDSTVEDSHLCF